MTEAAVYGSRQRYGAESPDMNRQEIQMSRAMALGDIPASEIERRITGPRFELFPPRYGLVHEQPGIREVLSTGSGNRDFRWQEGRRDAIAATARPSGAGWW
jgi:hypothetical protein